MIAFLRKPALAVFAALALLLASSLSATAQTRQLTDDQIRTIEYHYNLDKFMVAGCVLGATFGAITGLMTLSGFSVIASVPYISTGCSLGFLIGPTTMIIRDYLRSLRHPEGANHLLPSKDL
ncbi:MAG: hypothetical protein WCO00_07995 [Rhodospirillaceae bacterium]